MGFGCSVERCTKLAIVSRQGLCDGQGNTIDAPVCRIHGVSLDKGRSFTMKKRQGLWGKPRADKREGSSDE